MASAAMRLRAPERQMKNNSESLLAPAASSTFVSRSGKPASILLSGEVCHSTVRTRLPILSKSGSPTKVHSARVRTSIRTEPGSFSRRAQTSSTGTSWMWTASIDCTSSSTRPSRRDCAPRDPFYSNHIGSREQRLDLLDNCPERYADTPRYDDGTRDEILKLT